MKGALMKRTIPLLATTMTLAVLVFGEVGADLLEGGCGSNFYHGGSGPDHIDAAFDDPNNATESVFGGPGKDTIDADDGNQDTIHCGGGTDTVNRDTEDRFPDNDCETQN